MELTVAATEVAMAGESAERAAALAGRAIEALRADPILAVAVGFAVRTLTVADRLDEAEGILAATIDAARPGSGPTTGWARCSPFAPMSASGLERSATPSPTPRPRWRPTRTPAG